MSETTQIQNGTEVESIDELSEGDRVTVIKDKDIEIEDTGTDYKIPETEMKEDVVVIENALIDRIGEGGFGGLLQVDLIECDKSQQARGDSIPEYIDEDTITVITLEDDQ